MWIDTNDKGYHHGKIFVDRIANWEILFQLVTVSQNRIYLFSIRYKYDLSYYYEWDQEDQK